MINNNIKDMAKTIMFVEDSESVREAVKFTLEKAGYNVILGTDGSDALKYLENPDIDLVLTDLYMPNMDGIGLIKEIRRNKNHKHVPILFLTTETHKHKKIEAREAGATGWIVKPFVPEKLIATIRKVLR